MATALYSGTVTSSSEREIELELTMTHPDESCFGLSKLFALRCLADLSQDADLKARLGDEVAARQEAERLLDSVSVSGLTKATVVEHRRHNLRVAKKGKPRLTYLLKLRETPSWHSALIRGVERDVYAFDHPAEDPVVADAPPIAAAKKSGAKKAAGPSPTTALVARERILGGWITADGAAVAMPDSLVLLDPGGGQHSRPLPFSPTAFGSDGTVGVQAFAAPAGEPTRLAALSLVDGKVLWDAPRPCARWKAAGGELQTAWPVLGAGHGQLAVAGVDAGLSLFGLERSEPRWSVAVAMTLRVDVAPDLVVVTDWRPDANGYGARALSASDGSERWRTDGLGQVIAVTRDHVFTIAWVEHTHRLCARSLASGETLWTEEGLQFANAAADGTTLVQFAGSGEVRAWDVASGALRWKSSVAAFKGPAREPAVGPSGVLVVDGKKKLHVLDLGSGKPKASVALPTPHVDHALARGEDAFVFGRWVDKVGVAQAFWLPGLLVG